MTTATAVKPGLAGGIVADDVDDIARDKGQAERSPGDRSTRHVAKGKVTLRFAKPKPPEPAPKVDESRIDVPPQRPIINGFPSPERADGVVAARARFKTTYDQYRAVRQQRLTLAESLGLDAEYDAADVETVAGKMLADGIATSGIESLAELEKTERRLRSAAVTAAEAIGPALAVGIDAANAEVADILAPLKRATILALLEAVRQNEKHKRAILAIQSAGLSFGNIGAMNWSSQVFNPHIFGSLASGWLADGSLESADVAGLEHLLGG